MKQITESDLLRFIEEQFDEYPRRPVGFGITTSEFAKQTGRKNDKAANDLEKLVKAGTLERRTMASNNPSGSGWRGFVYARPTDWESLDQSTTKAQ